MNVLILNGSPRLSGNTHTVLETMKEQLEDRHTVTFVDVCRKKLSGCMACDACKANGGHCVCPDDSDALIQQIIAADFVILGTPVYWWGMSAQLKMVVDKLYSNDGKTGVLRNNPKKIGVVAVGANDVDNIQYQLIRDQFSCIAEHLNWELVFSLSFSAYEPSEIAQNEAALKQARDAVSNV